MDKDGSISARAWGSTVTWRWMTATLLALLLAGSAVFARGLTSGYATQVDLERAIAAYHKIHSAQPHQGAVRSTELEAISQQIDAVREDIRAVRDLLDTILLRMSES